MDVKSRSHHLEETHFPCCIEECILRVFDMLRVDHLSKRWTEEALMARCGVE